MLGSTVCLLSPIVVVLSAHILLCCHLRVLAVILVGCMFVRLKVLVQESEYCTYG